MAETNGEALMREMNTYLNQAESAQTDAETALPFESISDYLGDPTGFSDVTVKLWKKVSAVFDLSAKYNRHSPEYLKSLVQLEKGIKFLGSSCLQKHALEMKKYEFPELKQLNTTNLYTMAALHFNKLDRALTEYMDEQQNVDDGLLDMEYRFYNLMERIRTTEVKIYNYRDNYYFGKENSNPIIHGLAFSEKSWGKEMHKNDEPMAFQRAKSFSVVSGQLPVASGNEEGRMKKEDEAVAGEQVSNDINRDKMTNSSKTENREMVRDQFSKNPEAHVVCPDDAAKHSGSAPALPQSRHDGTAPEVRPTDPGKRSADSEVNSTSSEARPASTEVSSLSEEKEAAPASKSNQMQQEPNGTAAPVVTGEAAEDEEIPQCMKIMQQVVMRSRIRGLDYLGFTEREMRLLAADPLFYMIDPVMAADLRKALAEHDSG